MKVLILGGAGLAAAAAGLLKATGYSVEAITDEALAGASAWIEELSASVADLARPGGRLPLLSHRERADGVDPRISALLDWWSEFGPYPLVVGHHGGVRWTDAEQRQLFEDGVTNSPDLASTAHAARLRETPAGAIVRGQGLDAVPYEKGPWGFAPRYIQPNDPPSERDRLLRLYAAYGQAGKRFGLKWGGDWRSWKDYPHLETPDWQSLPLASALGPNPGVFS